MVALHERLLKICPVISEIQAETADQSFVSKRSSIPRLQSFGPYGGGGLGTGTSPKSEPMQKEILARLVQLQQFIQGGHGGLRSFQPSKLEAEVADTSLFEEIRSLKQTQEVILNQMKGVQDPEVKDLHLNGVSLTLQDVNLTLPS